MADFLAIASKTFNFEGGFQQFPNDTANYCNGALIGTNHGISAVAYKGYYNECPTVAEMKALTKDQAKTIYKKNYWDVIQGDRIANQSVAHIFFDAFIASGYVGLKRVKGYVNTYYGAAKIPVNSSALTQAQADLINQADAKKLFEIAKAGEIANRNSLVNSNPAKYGMFLNGWLNRLNAINFDGATNFVKRNPAIVLLFAFIAMATTFAIVKTVQA